MQPEETIEVARSEGEPTPSKPASEPVVPAEPAPETPAATTPELVELPDGRKVDAATVAQEYKNLLSDYTRKSQELATLKTGPAPLQTNTPTDPLADPNYIPQSYAEIVELAKKATFQEMQAKEQEKVEHQKAIETAVESQIKELKTVDPSLNENSLFAHATKYGFRDLKVAYHNMKDMNDMAKKIQQTTASNIQKRNDPVSVSPGATGARPDPSQFGSARDYLNAVKQST